MRIVDMILVTVLVIIVLVLVVGVTVDVKGIFSEDVRLANEHLIKCKKKTVFLTRSEFDDFFALHEDSWDLTPYFDAYDYKALQKVFVTYTNANGVVYFVLCDNRKDYKHFVDSIKNKNEVRKANMLSKKQLDARYKFLVDMQKEVQDARDRANDDFAKSREIVESIKKGGEQDEGAKGWTYESARNYRLEVLRRHGERHLPSL